jgi:DNA polymerase
MIAYNFPRVETQTVEYVDKYGETQERIKRVVSFYGYKEGQWRKQYLYGGLQCENIVQGTARCVMVDRMFAAEDEGYPLILTVHDELLAEVLNTIAKNAQDFERIMSVVPSFVPGLPLAAKTWEDMRYIK